MQYPFDVSACGILCHSIIICSNITSYSNASQQATALKNEWPCTLVVLCTSTVAFRLGDTNDFYSTI